MIKSSKIRKPLGQGGHQPKPSSFRVACTAALLLLCTVPSGFADAEAERRFPLLLNMVHHNPGEPQFVTHYDEPGYLKQLGYNGQIPQLSPQCGLTYDKAFPGVLAEPSEERMWIERHAHSIRLDLEYARRHGMPLYPFTDVLRKWAMDPEKSEEFYFNEYASETLGLNGQGLKDFRKLAMLATDATFLGQQSEVVPVSHWWCRDHYLTAVNVTKQVKAGKVDACIAEKVKAVEMWKEAEQLAAGITLKDPRDTEFMRVSTTYGRIKYQIIKQLWRIQLMLAVEKTNKKPLDQNAAKAAVAAYEKAFKEWRQLKRDNACCPTLYVDHEAVHCGPPFQKVLKSLKKRLGIK